MVQRSDPLTLATYPKCTAYVLELGIKSHNDMLNLKGREHVGVAGRRSLLSAQPVSRRQTEHVGLWVRGLTENCSLSLCYSASSQVVTFPFVSLR